MLVYILEMSGIYRGFDTAILACSLAEDVVVCVGQRERDVGLSIAFVISSGMASEVRSRVYR